MYNSSGWKIEERGGYRYPPGLKLNLPLYLSRRFFRVGNPILLFEHLVATYGKMAHYRVGPSDIVLVNEPEFIREILVMQPHNFIKERTQKRMRILLGEGLITSDGEFHKRQRRIAAPAFHRQRIQAYGELIVDRAAAMGQSWKQAVEIDISAEMMRLSLQVIARTLFAQEVTPDIESIHREVNAIMKLYNFLIALPRAEDYLHLPIPGLMRFRRARRHLDEVVHRMIADHRASGVDSGDLLSMLLRARDEEGDASNPSSGMSDEQLRDEVLTIFLAGYETVANALAWTWMLLAQNPEAEAKLHAELDQVLEGRLPTLEDLPRLRYTEMVLAESMRLYPPAWAMGRQATVDVRIGPYFLPAGTYFFFSQYLIQRSAEHFPEPLHFEPERFTPERKAGRSKFVYFPFGAGNRQCIGEAFAWMEANLILATLAQRWRLRLVPGQKLEVQPKITLRPKYGVRVVPEARF
ncbi:cytochrome P450 [Silvibacterium bohemicum]|uniref:Cytochrome P450 n=1 Tax=Silvibacterium bohemicum TaxID=1577686 RepID=A0A841JV06_9BACT|nr:cytochrome P450 [Silvibacterium bohemicum]MBB6142831.1 cytochrome P450 [Silvibacterium bohemicum]